MRGMFGAVLAAVWALGTAAAAAADDPTQSAEGLSTMSVADARAYAASSGGKVREVEDLEDGTYEMTIDYPDKVPVYLTGSDCVGAGEAKRCGEFQLSAYFGFDTEAEALAMEHTLDINWLSDVQVGTDLKVWRFEFVAGSTDRHMAATFQVFLDCVLAAADIVYPATPDGEGVKGG